MVASVYTVLLRDHISGQCYVFFMYRALHHTRTSDLLEVGFVYAVPSHNLISNLAELDFVFTSFSHAHISDPRTQCPNFSARFHIQCQLLITLATYRGWIL